MKQLNLNIKALVIKLILTLFLGSVLWVLIYRWLPPPATLHMFKRRAAAGKQDLPNKTIQYTYVALEDITPNVPLAMIAAEDQLFLKHDGFDFKAMKGAFEHNQTSKKVAGGSTISQQVAKNVFLWHGRSYLRKGVEAYFTFLIELLWGKKRIMEVYLNIAEMGDRIFGIEEASRIYFKKSPKNLTPNQAALIASVLPNPVKYSVKNPSRAILRKRRRVVLNMRRLGGVNHVQSITSENIK
ncbi:MAG: monofunctional biosynthetic peptidoglycan transglycosylase [Adhaeribacter sp.]